MQPDPAARNTKSTIAERAQVWLAKLLGRWVFRPSRPMLDIRRDYERLSVVSRERLRARYTATSSS